MTPGELKITQVSEEDIKILYDLARACNASQPDDYFERCLREQKDGARSVFMAQHGGIAAGFVTLNWRPSYALYKKLEIPELQDLNVVPELRQRGIATALIRHCEECARNAGCAQMGIAVGLGPRYGAAQRLYVKMGYVPDGFGITYDRQPVRWGEVRPIDDDLCLMLVRELGLDS